MSTVLDKTVWSNVLLKNLYDRSPFILNANTDFEGDAKSLKVVKFNFVGAMTVGNYSIGSDMTMTAQPFSSASLVIDQQKYVFQMIDRLYQRQYDVDFMTSIMEEAASSLRDGVDSYLADLVSTVSSSQAVNSGVWTIGTDGDSAASSSTYDLIAKLNLKLDQSNIPADDRFAILPHFCNETLVRDTRFTHANDNFLNGLPGRKIGGTDVYFSDNVSGSNSTHFNVLAGRRNELQFASGFDSLTILEPEKQVGSALKILFVYGGKITRAQGMATQKITSF